MTHCTTLRTIKIIDWIGKKREVGKRGSSEIVILTWKTMIVENYKLKTVIYEFCFEIQDGLKKLDYIRVIVDRS